MSTSSPSRPSVLRIAITGLGDWAWRHVQLIRETPGFELCAISSRSAAAAERAARELPGIQVFTTQAAMLAAARPDIVVITTPHHTHAPFALEAFAAGAHVIVEKPVATTLADAKAMLTAARAAGRSLAVYHNRHWDPWLRVALDAVRSGRLGTLTQADTTWPYYFSPETWRGQKARSGGQFYDVGAHLSDYLLQFAGEYPELVSGQLFSRPGADPSHNEDQATAFLRFRSGLVSRLCCSAIDVAPARRFHLVGDKGTLTDEWNWGGGVARVWTGRPGQKVQCEELPYGHEDETGGGRPLYANLADHFLRGGPLEVPPEHAVRVVAVLLAAEQSATQGGAWVRFDEFVGDL